MKYLYIIIFTLALMIGCSGGGGSDEDSVPYTCDNPSTEHIVDMGYYWGMSKAYGNHLPDLVDHSNMTYIHVTGDKQADQQMITQALEAGVRPLIYLDPRHVWLDHDWNRLVHIHAENWYNFKWLMERYSQWFAGFYVFDEPYHYGISKDTQEWILSYYKQAFPDVQTWITYAHVGKAIPSNLDVVSATPAYGGCSAGEYRAKLDQLQAHMHDGQRLAITMDTYGPDGLGTIAYQEYLADTAREYFDLAKCDPNVVALFMFLYPDQNGHLGVESMQLLEAELIEIYDEIYGVTLPWEIDDE